MRQATPLGAEVARSQPAGEVALAPVRATVGARRERWRRTRRRHGASPRGGTRAGQCGVAKPAGKVAVTGVKDQGSGRSMHGIEGAHGGRQQSAQQRRRSGLHGADRRGGERAGLGSGRSRGEEGHACGVMVPEFGGDGWMTMGREEEEEGR